MKESVSLTLQQLRENTRLIEQYKIRMKTLKVRIAIEQKVKDSIECAKFEERYRRMEQNVAESTRRQEALQVQVTHIKQSWSSYFGGALTEIKERFEKIDSAAMIRHVEEQRALSEKMD